MDGKYYGGWQWWIYVDCIVGHEIKYVYNAQDNSSLIFDKQFRESLEVRFELETRLFLIMDSWQWLQLIDMLP